jgi:RNA-binding protein
MLTKGQRNYLRTAAQQLPPIVMIGKNGMGPKIVAALEQVLEAHELVKVKFLDRKDDKRAITDDLANQTSSEVVTIIGHMAVFFRQQRDVAKRRITLPND